MTHPEYKKLNDNYYPIVAALVVRDGYQCACCHEYRKLVVDHIVAVKQNGKTELENLQLLCKKCNRWKESETHDFRPANRGAIGLETPRYTPYGALVIRTYRATYWPIGITTTETEVVDVKGYSVKILRYKDQRVISVGFSKIYPPDLQHLI